tara:strand:+ start:7432 stop:8037 length:606 start_codon:yes stop_codon:yes gene_type:complete
MVYEKQPLKYEFDALEPYIDSQTMEIHHTKHHQSYADKLNKAVEGNQELLEKSIQELLENLESIPEEIKTAVKNNAGGVWNHDFFFNSLKKDTPPSGEIIAEIEKKFGSFENFKIEFTKSASTLFGSGWTWLVLNGDELKIINTSGHDSPISQGMKPILVIDVWEHSYYLKYQNRRPEYIEAFWNIINWKEVEKRFLESKT